MHILALEYHLGKKKNAWGTTCKRFVNVLITENELMKIRSVY